MLKVMEAKTGVATTTTSVRNFRSPPTRTLTLALEQLWSLMVSIVDVDVVVVFDSICR